MSIFTDYKKEIQQIEDMWKIKHNEYESEIKKLKTNAKKYCSKYNDQIHVINADRHAMRDEIKNLYDFLINFGNIGEKITPFDYITEDSDSININDDISFDDAKRKESDSVFEKVFENAGVSAAAIASMMGLFTPAAVFAGAIHIYKHHKEKELYKEYLIKFESAKDEYKKSLDAANDIVKKYKLICDISNVYREIIATVRDAIKYTIIPELSDITAFLYADAIINKFAYNEDFSMGVVPSDIKEFENTRYNEHYLFVKNSFEFYKIITEFFTKQILTQLKDCKITRQESDKFTEQINRINQKNDELKKLAVFNKETEK